MKELSVEEKEQIIREVFADRRLDVYLRALVREYLRLLGYEIIS